jgi:hypothetical protein
MMCRASTWKPTLPAARRWSETVDANCSSGAEDDPFAPLPPGAGSERPEPDKEIWEPVMPAPGEPPEVGQIRQSAWGVAIHRWVCRDADGCPLFATARFERTKADGQVEKEILPYSYGRKVWTTKAGHRAAVEAAVCRLSGPAQAIRAGIECWRDQPRQDGQGRKGQASGCCGCCRPQPAPSDTG